MRYEAIVVDARDVNSNEPESTCGIYDTIEEAEAAIQQYREGHEKYLLSSRIDEVK